MKMLLRLSLSLVVLEVALGAGLLLFFIWVEKPLCAVELFAAGHCYTTWFSEFEEGFYLVALGLIFISPMWLIKKYIHDNQASYYRYFLYLSYFLLLQLLWWTDGKFIWQMLLVMLALKITQHSVLQRAKAGYE